jgi:hypothetical protein
MEISCNERWSEMTPTEESSVRLCSVCKSNVQQVTSESELKDAISAGVCIYYEALRAGVRRLGLPRGSSARAARILGLLDDES